jgi:DNA-directed RNA polymerase specialized sigma24 family protein
VQTYPTLSLIEGVSRLVSADVIAALRPSLLQRARRFADGPAEAEDLVQDTLLRLVEKEPEWRGLPHLRHWLFTVMGNLVKDRGRKAAKTAPVLAYDLDGTVTW